MSLSESKLPSLKDKFSDQAALAEQKEIEEPALKAEEELATKKATKGRKNKSKKT